MRVAMGLALAALAMAGCSRPRELSVDHAWVRLPAVRAQPAAAYFTLHGGKEDATLIDVSADVAIRSEMHTDMAGGMKRIAAVPVPAGSTTTFAPGARHVMLWGLAPTVKPGGTVTLTFTFGNGERILQDAALVDAGAPAPK